VVPSLKRLEPYGRWYISDTVLTTLLGRVFCNVKLLEEYEGWECSADGFMCATQAMPFVQIVECIKTRPFNKMNRPRGYELMERGPGVVQFVQENEERVLYLFVGEDRNRYMCWKKKDEW